MKLKNLLIILIALFILSGCDLFSKKTEYDKFMELYDEILDKHEDMKSYKMVEESYFNFSLNGQEFKSSITATGETIIDPFYSKAKITYNIPSIGTFNQDMLFLEEDDDTYLVIIKENDTVYSETYNKKKFEEDFGGQYFNDFGFVPKSIKKVDENEVDGETLVTYEGKIKVKDMGKYEKETMKTLLEFYISPNTKLSTYDDIKISKQFIIKKTTKQIVEVNYDISDLLTKAMKDLYKNMNLDFEVTNTDAKYSIIIKSINDVTKDEKFINEMKK